MSGVAGWTGKSTQLLGATKILDGLRQAYGEVAHEHVITTGKYSVELGNSPILPFKVRVAEAPVCMPGNQASAVVAAMTDFSDADAATMPPSPVIPSANGFLAPNFDCIPVEIRSLARWMTWLAEGRGGAKPTKVPYNPTLSNSRGKSNDPDTWGTFDQAVAAYDEGGRTGVGFVLNNDGLVGIDIDHCVRDGIVDPAALALLDEMEFAYVELSPSGTGLRGFGYAETLDKGASGIFRGLKVELYSDVRFLTVTGRAIKSGAFTTVVRFKELAEKIRGDRKVDQATGEVLDVPAAERQAELLKRIMTGKDYHASLCGLSASYVACGMHSGAVVTLLRSVMMNVTAPHDDRWQDRYKSIPSLVSSAYAKFAHSGINLVGITGAAPLVMEAPVIENQPAHPAALTVPPHLLRIPGKLGLMVDWTNATSKKPQPVFAVQAALALGSVAMGRKFSTNLENWTSLYFLNIAASGTGKEHAKTAIERCLTAAGLGVLIGPCEYTSDSAIDSALLVKPTHVAVIDEFGLLLETGKAKNNPNGGTARKRLMEMFGRAHATLQPKGFSMAALSKEQIAGRGSRAVENPALTVLGMTTPGTFYNAVGSGSMTDGFLNRFIIVESDLGRQVGEDTEYVEPPPDLVQWVKACRIAGVGDIAEFQADVLHDVRPTPTVISFSAAARRLFKALEVHCNVRMDELDCMGVSEMYTRVREIAMKVSLIVAHSCGGKEIDAEHAQWAIDYVCYWADRAIKSLAANVADSPFAALCNDVYNLIQKAGAQGLTVADLSRKSAKFKGTEERARNSVFAILKSDRDLRNIDFKPRSGKGKTRSAYVAAEFLEQAQLPQ